MSKGDASLWRHDGRKSPVPLWLKNVFQGRSWMVWWCKRLERLLYELEQQDTTAHLDSAKQEEPSLEWTQYMEVRKTCNQLKQILIDTHRKMPFCRCPKKDSDPQCPVCKGKGWINASQLAAHQISLRK